MPSWGLGDAAERAIVGSAESSRRFRCRVIAGEPSSSSLVTAVDSARLGSAIESWSTGWKVGWAGGAGAIEGVVDLCFNVRASLVGRLTVLSPRVATAEGLALVLSRNERVDALVCNIGLLARGWGWGGGLVGLVLVSQGQKSRLGGFGGRKKRVGSGRPKEGVDR